MSFEFNVRMGEKGFGFTLSVDGITMAQVDQVATMIENVLTSKKDDISRILKEGADKINEAVEKAKKAEDKTGTDDKEGGFEDSIHKDKDDTEGGEEDRNTVKKGDFEDNIHFSDVDAETLAGVTEEYVSTVMNAVKKGDFGDKIHKAEGGEEDINDIKKKIISEYISPARSKKETNEEAGKHAKHMIAGKTFVVSGSCTTFKSKKELEDYLTAHGGKVSSMVTADTDAVICSYSNTSAFYKAKECGIPIFSEHKFLTEFLQGNDVRNYLKTSVIMY